MTRTGELGPSSDSILDQVDQDMRAVLPELLDNFLRDATAMREALRQGDYETIQTMGHGMKGVGGFGLDDLSVLGLSIEQAAKARDFNGVQKLIEEVVAYVERVEAIDL